MRLPRFPLFLALLAASPTSSVVAAKDNGGATGGDAAGSGSSSSSSSTSGVAKAQGPPPFFLQDSSDSLCLAGEDFRRCSIDTLFFVVGSPGSYQIHRRPQDETDVDPDGTCLSKKHCDKADSGHKDKDAAVDVKLAKCTHCGAKAWNIHGDSKAGYVLTETSSGTQLCLVRPKGSKKARLAPCDSAEPYTPLQLQFASAADVEAMGSPGARLIGAASDGDKKLVQRLLREEKSADVNARDWDELTPLIPAASAGHLDVVKLLLKEGADVNAKDKDGITALMEASIMGHGKIVDLLLKEGAEVDAKANSGVTALWLAAGEGRADVLRSLLKKGADANNHRSDDISALMTAAVGGHAAAVKLLRDNGADARFADAEGITPLMNAAENGTVAVLKLLVEGEDSPDIPDKTPYVDLVSNTGFTALIIAAAHGHTEAVEYLLKMAKADVNAMHETHVTPLMYAAASGHINVMALLLDVGKVDVNELHSNGGSALLEASTGGAGKAMTFLLERGAVPDLRDLDGVTPLHAVTSKGDLEGTIGLLDALRKKMSAEELKEHINLPSHSGGTAVMFAAAGGHPKVTQLMIDEGADVNAVAIATPEYLEKLAKMIEEGTVDPEEDPHVDGVTGVHVAAEDGHLDCVNLLIAAGADVSVLDDEERTPLQLAVKGNYGEVASALVKAGADPDTPYVDDDGETHNLLMDSVIVENADFALLLIEHGADLYHKDDYGVTTLLQAAHRGISNVTEALLDRHAAAPKVGEESWVDAASDEGVTPLLAAASEGHVAILRKLLSTGKADVNARDKEGTNSLMAAAARGHMECVRPLLEVEGIEVDAQNSDGHTALMHAHHAKNQVETLWERFSQYSSDTKRKNSDDAEASKGVDGSEATTVVPTTTEKEEKEVNDGGTGALIWESIRNHTTVIDLLMQAGADTKLKDKEGHTVKDFDFQPDADGELLEREEKAERQRDESRNEL